MRSMPALLFITVFAVSPLIRPQATAEKGPEKPATAEQQVLDLEKRWFEAEKAHNTAFLEQIFADDLVVGSAMGDVVDRDQILSRMRSPDHRIEELHSDHVRVRVYGNVAVVTEHATIRGHDKGRPFGGEFRYVRIFVKRQGRWQVSLIQATPLPAPAAASK
jgi:ketosteroid isomerase-like protein